jgi:ABC-type nitrate/sulfonate/bicarbonate transport system substrate-binding protein
MALGLAAACGGTTANSGAGATPKSTESFAIALPAINAAFALPYLAKELGYFSAAGVDVAFTNGVGTNALNLVATGQVDVTMFGTGNSFPPVTQGRSTTVIYNQSGGGIAGDVAVKAGSDYKSLNDLSGQRVATLGTSGSGYGFTQLYSKYVADHGGKPFQIVPFSDATTLSTSLQAGSVQAVVGNRGQFTSGLLSGLFRLVIDMADSATRKQYVGGYYAETAVFGLTENLKKKREAVVRFLIGIDKANSWMLAHKPSEIASQLKKNDAFGPTSETVLTADVTSTVPFATPNRGQISQQLWDLSLKQYALWNIAGVDVSSADFSYSKRVDMSYLKTAQGKA